MVEHPPFCWLRILYINTFHLSYQTLIGDASTVNKSPTRNDFATQRSEPYNTKTLRFCVGEGRILAFTLKFSVSTPSEYPP